MSDLDRDPTKLSRKELLDLKSQLKARFTYLRNQSPPDLKEMERVVDMARRVHGQLLDRPQPMGRIVAIKPPWMGRRRS
jgi:hypothetical protein